MKRKLLIIDDEIDFCMIMKGYFSSRDYEVLTAYTLQEGWNILNEHKPEILFLDNNLPDGRGWDRINEIVEIFPHTRIYMVSAHGNISPLKEKNEKVVVWEKPISREQLKTVI